MKFFIATNEALLFNFSKEFLNNMDSQSVDQNDLVVHVFFFVKTIVEVNLEILQ